MSDVVPALGQIAVLVVALAAGRAAPRPLPRPHLHLAEAPRGRAGVVPRAARRPRRRPALAHLRHVGARLLAGRRPGALRASAGCRSTCRSRSASPALPADGAWNTAVSFVTNTNWQWYSGEAAVGHLIQMSGLTVQNFVSRRRSAWPSPRRSPAAWRRNRAATAGSATSGPTWSAPSSGCCCRSRSSPPCVLVAPRRRPELRSATARRCTRSTGGSQARHRRAGRQPGGDQGARHQRRRLLQRQLRAPVREPDAVHQPVRDLPDAACIPFAMAWAFGLIVGDRRQGVAVAGRDGAAARRLDRACSPGPRWPGPAPRPHAGRRRDGGQGGPLRRGGLRALRRRHDRHVDRRRQLHARLAHRPRRRRRDVQHDARRDRARRRRLRPLRHVDAGRRHGLPGRPDGRPHAGVPRQEDRPARDRPGRALRADHPGAACWSASPSRSPSTTGSAGLQESGPHGLSEALYAVTSAANNNGSRVRRADLGHAVLEHAARAAACCSAGSCR